MSEQAMLMQLVETADTVEPDWQDALRRAGYMGRHLPRRREMLRRRRVLVVVGAALAVIYSMPAVAQERWWWFSPESTLKPISQVVTVGNWKTEELLDPRAAGPAQTAPIVTGDVRWIVQAFVSRHRELNKEMLCLVLSRDRPSPETGLGGGGACGFPVHGLLSLTTPPERLHWVGYTASIPGPVASGTPKIMFGPAAPNVRTVELENILDRRVIRVPTHQIPDELGLDARFWIVVIPPDQLVHTIVPRDENGEALERWRLPTAQ